MSKRTFSPAPAPDRRMPANGRLGNSGAGLQLDAGLPRRFVRVGVRVQIDPWTRTVRQSAVQLLREE